MTIHTRNGIRPVGPPFATRSETLAIKAMAATSQPLATQVALDILKRGGNAVDAAIAANATLAVTEPTGCGLGGDLFAILWMEREKKLYGLNASGRSPFGLQLKEFQRRNLSQVPVRGPLSVSVPGAVDGWSMLQQRFGSLSLADLLDPAVQYARQGFPVSPVIAWIWEEESRPLRQYPNFSSTFCPSGSPPRAGEIFRNPDLASSLESIQKEGRDSFYHGELARRIADYCKQNNCFLDVQDLNNHMSCWVAPVSVDYRGFEVWQLPPNTQGIAALQMLNILENLDVASMGSNSCDFLHSFIETKKMVFEDRARYYAGPDCNELPIPGLLSKEYARHRRRLLNSSRALESVEAGIPDGTRQDTVYLTVADEQRNMISLIQSNFMGFGSGLVADGTGFVLQNRGHLFHLQDPTHPNLYAPGKRPFHTLMPGFVTRQGRPYLSFGVMGGDMQPQGQVQVLCNLIDFGMDVQAAGDCPRCRHFGSSSPTGDRLSAGGTVSLEAGIPASVRHELEKRGHRIVENPHGFGGYQAILFDAEKNIYRGATESRKDGTAAGF